MMSRISGMALETFRESRGPGLPIVIAVGGILLALIGKSLPPPLGTEGSLAGAFYFGGISAMLSLVGLAMGSAALAQDRNLGFYGMLISKPIPGSVYFLGRFLGLSLRLTLFALGAALLGGCLLSLLSPGSGYAPVEGANRFFMADKEYPLDPLFLLGSGHGPAVWTFAGPKPVKGKTAPAAGDETVIRFAFRPRYARADSFSNQVPCRIQVYQEEKKLLDQALVIKNRKSLELAVTSCESGDLVVLLQIEEGQNFLEIQGRGCTLAFGASPPLVAMLKAMVSLLPVLYLGLAVALVFSAFVSLPVALFAACVLNLFVLMSPLVSTELDYAVSLRPGTHTHTHDPMAALKNLETEPETESGFLRWAGTGLSKAITLLPDPRAGGSLKPLSRMECPGSHDLYQPWLEGLPHLVLVLIIGCLISRRRLRC